MSKILILAIALLATPVAAADGIDILSPTEWSCDDDYGYQYDSDSYETNNSRHSYSWGHDWNAYGCESSTDNVDGGVTASGDEVVTVRWGSDSADSWNANSTWQDESYSRWWNGSSSYGYYSHSARQEGSTSESGSEIVASTLVADVRQHDGCAYEYGYSSQSAYGYSYTSYGNDSWSSQGESRSSQESSRSACDSTVALTSNVTDVRAGREDECASYSSSYAESHSYSSNYGSDDYARSANWSTERCHDGYFASAGSERIDVGSRSECHSQGFESSSTYESNRTGSYSSCQSKWGVFGPTGLGIYTEDASYQSSWCDGSNCTDESSASRAVVAEQAYTPRIVYYLP